MSSSSDLFRQFESARNVAILASLVTAAKQNNDNVAAPDEVDPITRAVVDPHLRHARAHRLHVTGIAQRQTTDSGSDAGARVAIPQPGKPGGEYVSLPDFRRAGCLLQRTICQVSAS